MANGNFSDLCDLDNYFVVNIITELHEAQTLTRIERTAENDPLSLRNRTTNQNGKFNL